MNKNSKRTRQEDSFTLSMVDLFGCGFIAAIFLFIMNMLQPHIDAAAAGAATASGDAGQLGEGLSGPVFISIKSEVPIHFPSWPKQFSPPDARAFSAEDGRFKHIYDQVLPDASTLKWPLQADLCAKREAADACASADTADYRFDVVVRMTAGYSTMTAYFVRQPAGEPVNVAFDTRRSLTIKPKRAFEQRLDIDLRPERRDATSYRSLGAFFSSEPFVAASGFAGGVDKIFATTDGREKVSIQPQYKIAKCWVFANSAIPGGSAKIECPSDPAKLIAAVGDEPWRSDVFVLPAKACLFPFEEHLLCTKTVDSTPKRGEAPSTPPASVPSVRSCRWWLCTSSQSRAL